MMDAADMFRYLNLHIQMYENEPEPEGVLV